MRLRGSCLFVLALMVLPSLAPNAYADIFASAASYAVLSTTEVTNPTTNADTKIFGDMGAVSCTGFTVFCTFGPGMVSGATNLSNGPYTTALADSDIAYTALANTPFSVNFTGSCLGSDPGCLNNLAPGVYFSSLTATLLNGALTLAGGSDPNPLWIFQTAAGFTTASNSSVLVTGIGAAAAGVYFEVGSQATLGDNTAFLGNILAGTAVVFNPGAQITCGRAFTDTPAGTAVTFAGNNPAAPTGLINEVSGTCLASSSGYNGGTIVTGPGGGPVVGPGAPPPVPEPGTLLLLGTGLASFAGVIRRKLIR
jgi:hypothetical protein